MDHTIIIMTSLTWDDRERQEKKHSSNSYEEQIFAISEACYGQQKSIFDVKGNSNKERVNEIFDQQKWVMWNDISVKKEKKEEREWFRKWKKFREGKERDISNIPNINNLLFGV